MASSTIVLHPSPPPPPPAYYCNSSSPKFIRYPLVTAISNGNQRALENAVTNIEKLLPLDRVHKMLNRRYSEFNEHTLLYVAVTKDYPEICKLLLSKGANPHLDSAYTIAKKKGGEVFASLEPRLLGKLLDVSKCSICEEVNSLYTFECGHVFCYDCSCNWAKECSSSLTPKCPQLNCPLPVHVNVFKNLLTPNDFDAYINSLVRIALSAIDLVEWCTSCPNGFFLSSRDGPCTVSCHACRVSWCTSCRLPAHSSMTCEDAKIGLSLQDKENDIWKSQNTKQCPQCKVHIQKNQGCSHITCRHCKYQFCWICLGKYQPGKHTIGDKCPCSK